MLEEILEKKIGELGMALSRPLPEEDFRIGAEIDDVGNPPKSAIEMIMDMMKGKPYIPTFLQERVEYESVPKIIRVSGIRKGFGIEYGVSSDGVELNEYIAVNFDQSYLSIDCFDVNFYKDTNANTLFTISVKNGKVSLDYIFEPKSYSEFKAISKSKSLREYTLWSIGLRKQVNIGAPPEQVVDFMFDFLKRRVLRPI